MALVVAAGALFVAAWMLLDVPPLSTLRTWSDETGAWFPVLFWLLYVLITQFPIPRTLMTVSAGILFGTGRGILIALTATTVSAVVSLLIVRTLLRDWVEPRLTHPAVENINRRLEERGWLAILSLRMIAAVPFSIMNYAAALTRVPGIGPKGAQKMIIELKDKVNALGAVPNLTAERSPSSASASEIFAGVIKDYKRGLIIGDSSTYGKGTVQRIIDREEIGLQADEDEH